MDPSASRICWYVVLVKRINGCPKISQLYADAIYYSYVINYSSSDQNCVFQKFWSYVGGRRHQYCYRFLSLIRSVICKVWFRLLLMIQESRDFSTSVITVSSHFPTRDLLLAGDNSHLDCDFNYLESENMGFVGVFAGYHNSQLKIAQWYRRLPIFSIYEMVHCSGRKNYNRMDCRSRCGEEAALW